MLIGHSMGGFAALISAAELRRRATARLAGRREPRAVRPPRVSRAEARERLAASVPGRGAGADRGPLGRGAARGAARERASASTCVQHAPRLARKPVLLVAGRRDEVARPRCITRRSPRRSRRRPRRACCASRSARRRPRVLRIAASRSRAWCSRGWTAIVCGPDPGAERVFFRRPRRQPDARRLRRHARADRHSIVLCWALVQGLGAEPRALDVGLRARARFRASCSARVAPGTAVAARRAASRA